MAGALLNESKEVPKEFIEVANKDLNEAIKMLAKV
jgi:hypothetical protein